MKTLWSALVATMAVASGCAGGPSAEAARSTAADTPSAAAVAGVGHRASTQWLSYDATRTRTAAVAAVPSLNPATKAWTKSLGGVVHGEVVADGGRLFAATETNRVVALNPKNGHIVWSRTLGSPLTNVDAVAGCGDIDPLGITSTPVIDPASQTIYVVAEISNGHGTVHHELEGLSLSTGRVKESHDVDPPLPRGETAVHLLQRASLALANHRIYVAYGGNDGDCGAYHGWVVSERESGAADKRSFEVASNGEGGAIWEAGGAPAVDAHGAVYVTTGNANPDPPQGGPDRKRYTESVVTLSPTLKALASFKDEIAGGDEDLATGNPVLLPDGDVFAVGKTDVGYILRQSNLHRVAAIKGVCGSDPDGGPAYDRAEDRLFVPCKGGGVQVLNLKHDTLGQRLTGANSAPILIGQDLWAAQYNGGAVFEYNAKTGKTLQTRQTGLSIPNFAAPSTADGLLLIGTNNGVTAFR